MTRTGCYRARDTCAGRLLGVLCPCQQVDDRICERCADALAGDRCPKFNGWMYSRRRRLDTLPTTVWERMFLPDAMYSRHSAEQIEFVLAFLVFVVVAMSSPSRTMFDVDGNVFDHRQLLFCKSVFTIALITSVYIALNATLMPFVNRGYRRNAILLGTYVLSGYRTMRNYYTYHVPDAERPLFAEFAQWGQWMTTLTLFLVLSTLPARVVYFYYRVPATGEIPYPPRHIYDPSLYTSSAAGLDPTADQ